MINKTVSIITPAYNNEETIANAIASVINQSYSNWEMLIVDDNSVDKTRDVIQRYAQNDKRIKLVCLKENFGAGVARNSAIQIATGDYIAFLDSDDLWHPKKLEKQIDFMVKYQIPLSFTSYQLIDKDGSKLNKNVKAKSYVNYSNALFYNPIGCLTAMYDVNYFGKQYMPELRKRQDYALWLKLLKKSDGRGIDEVLAYYRTGNASISSNKFDLIKYQWTLYYEVEKLGLIKSLFYTFTSSLKKVKEIIFN